MKDIDIIFPLIPHESLYVKWFGHHNQRNATTQQSWVTRDMTTPDSPGSPPAIIDLLCTSLNAQLTVVQQSDNPKVDITTCMHIR